MKKEQMIKEINEILNAFKNNSFLVPCTHTEFQYFTNSDEQYRTYSNDSRDYISIEIKTLKGSFSFSSSLNNGQWTMQGGDLLTMEPITTQIKKKWFYLKEIYNEIHSLNIDKTKIKGLRKKIEAEKEKIRCAEKEINILKKEIEDSKKDFPTLNLK